MAYHWDGLSIMDEDKVLSEDIMDHLDENHTPLDQMESIQKFVVNRRNERKNKTVLISR